MSIDCTFYSDNKLTFHIDLDDEWESEKRFKRCPTLTITHGEDGKALHFVTLEQLQQLRDLLNEKLHDPCAYIAPPTPEECEKARREVVSLMHTMPSAIAGRFE